MPVNLLSSIEGDDLNTVKDVEVPKPRNLLGEDLETLDPVTQNFTDATDALNNAPDAEEVLFEIDPAAIPPLDTDSVNVPIDEVDEADALMTAA
jgi:hypothetical protein